MDRRNLLNIALLLLIGLLALLAVYEPGIEKPVEPPALLSLDRAAITRIAIRRDGQPDVELERQGSGQWWMTQPLRHAADPFRIDSLLNITTLKSLGRFEANTDKLAAFQLDQPRVTLTLNGDTVLAFGANTPLDQRRYVMHGGQIHLVSDTLYYHLIGSYPTFLRKQLLPEGVRIDAIQLPGLHLAWNEGRWHVSPEPEQFSADQVTRLVDNWRLASALEIKPYDHRPGEELALTLSGGAEAYRLLLTAREPDLVLARPELGIQYQLDPAAAMKLLQLPHLEPPMEETVPLEGQGHGEGERPPSPSD